MPQVIINEIKDRYFEDKRGLALQNVLTKKTITNESDLHVVTIKPGQIRGNHLHKETDEWIIVCGKNCQLSYKDQKTVKDIHLSKDNKAFEIFIPRQIIHALKNNGDTELLVLSFFTRKPHDYEQDVERITILE